MKEYLNVLDDAAFGSASEVEPKFTSHSDPASPWTGALKGPAFFAYADCPSPLELAITLAARGGFGMARQRHTDEDILKLLGEIELQLAAGDDVASACRSFRISDATYYIYGRLSRCK